MRNIRVLSIQANICLKALDQCYRFHSKVSKCKNAGNFQ